MTLDELRGVLEIVRDRRWPLDRASRYFQIDFHPSKPVRRDFEFWMSQRSIPDPFKEETVDRWWFEMFLQSRGLVPLAWMALQLGMLPDSLRDLRRRMDEMGPLLAYHISPDLVGKSFEEDLLAQLPQYHFRTFRDHDDFCVNLHRWLREVFHVPIQPAFCETSRQVGRGTDFAKYWDILSLNPLSPRYQVWLDFGKWMTLASDRCSVLIYALYPEELARYLAGKELPDIPSEVVGISAGDA